MEGGSPKLSFHKQGPPVLALGGWTPRNDVTALFNLIDDIYIRDHSSKTYSQKRTVFEPMWTTINEGEGSDIYRTSTSVGYETLYNCYKSA